MVMSRFTNIELDNLKPRDKAYRVSDRNGLYINVGTSGTKTFQFRYQVYSNGKERDRWYTIGKYPKLTLKQARAELQVLRLDVSRGLDVQENKLARRKLALTPKGKTTFKKVATDWLEHRKTRVGQNTWDKDWSRLERFILPNFATTDVKDILAKDLLDQMNKVAEINGRETAQRTMNQVGSVLKYAMRLGYVKHNVANGMTEYLPKPVITSHKAILDTTKLGEFVYVMENNEKSRDIVGCAMRIIPHIFVRHSEMLSMKWSDLNFKDRIWQYSVSKTKDKGVKEHTVFLSEQVLKILEDLKNLTAHKEKVFAGGDKYGQISQRAVLFRMREFGFTSEQVSHHGFRATARTLGVEKLKVESVVIEKCLAHKTKEVHGESYDRTTRLPEREEFYQTWSDFLIDCKNKYQKTKIKRVK